MINKQLRNTVDTNLLKFTGLMSYNRALDMEFLAPRLWVIDIMIHIIPEKSKQYLLIQTVHECICFPTLTDIRFREFIICQYARSKKFWCNLYFLMMINISSYLISIGIYFAFSGLPCSLFCYWTSHLSSLKEFPHFILWPLCIIKVWNYMSHLL